MALFQEFFWTVLSTSVDKKSVCSCCHVYSCIRWLCNCTDSQQLIDECSTKCVYNLHASHALSCVLHPMQCFRLCRMYGDAMLWHMLCHDNVERETAVQTVCCTELHGYIKPAKQALHVISSAIVLVVLAVIPMACAMHFWLSFISFLLQY